MELLAQDIRRQPELLSQVVPTFRERTRALAGELGRPSRIYIVGCGDSLNVGMAVRFEWERVLGLPVHAIPALTFSRFEARNVPAGCARDRALAVGDGRSRGRSGQGHLFARH